MLLLLPLDIGVCAPAAVASEHVVGVTSSKSAGWVVQRFGLQMQIMDEVGVEQVADRPEGGGRGRRSPFCPTAVLPDLVVLLLAAGV